MSRRNFNPVALAALAAAIGAALLTRRMPQRLAQPRRGP